jgi:hypothetical protein
MDFYGLGDVSISKEDRGGSEPALANRHAFMLRVNGDLNGILLLTSDHLPVESDTSSGLELLNVLSGHVVDLLHEEGLDLVTSPPSALGLDARSRLESLALSASRSWRGSFSGNYSFEFTLQLLAHHARPDALLQVSHPSQDSLTEKMPCLDRSLDS